MDKKRLAIVYLPNGNERKFCTVDLNDSTYELCQVIEGESNRLNVAYLEDGNLTAESFVLMPYTLQLF